MVPSSIAGTLALYVMGLMAFVLVVPDLVQFAGRVSRKHVVLSATIALVIAGMLGSVYATTTPGPRPRPPKPPVVFAPLSESCEAGDDPPEGAIAYDETEFVKGGWHCCFCGCLWICKD